MYICYIYIICIICILKNKFIYLWLHWVFNAACWFSLAAVSGGLLFVVVHRLLIVMTSLVSEQRSKVHDLVAPLHVGSSWTRDQTHIPCIGGQILHLWTTREALHMFYTKIHNLIAAPYSDYQYIRNIYIDIHVCLYVFILYMYIIYTHVYVYILWLCVYKKYM